MVPSPGCRLLVLSVLLLTAGHTNGSINTDHRQFADDLTTALSLYTSGSNQCISTWGISMALSLVYPGCDEECAQDMQMVLRYPLPTYAYEWRDGLVWEDTANRIAAANEGECADENVRITSLCRNLLPQIEIANTIWLDTWNELVEEYNNTVGNYAKQIDFFSNNAGEEVNAWVEENTNGLIDEIIDDGPIDHVLLAINSIYFKASWKFPFEERLINEDTFYSGWPSDSVESSTAHFMHAVGERHYSHVAIPGYQMLRLPFNKDSLSMVFVLPSTEDMSFVKSSDVLDAIPNLNEVEDVAMAIPKFKFESEYDDGDLILALQSLGMSAPFAATLCGLFKGGCGFIDGIIQKTAIDVNEKGVEAVAATMALTGRAPPPPSIEFMANHPFQFFIHDEVEDIILFEGLVVEPGIPEGSEAPFEALHSDTGFWNTWFGVPALISGRVARPRLRGKPIIMSRTASSVVIRFVTSMPTKAKIIYSKHRRIPRRRRKSSKFVITREADGGYIASITLTGLEAKTRYYFRVIIRGGIQDRRKRRFNTLPS